MEVVRGATCMDAAIIFSVGLDILGIYRMKFIRFRDIVTV